MENISNDYLLSFLEGHGEGVSLDYKMEGYLISVAKEDKQDAQKVKKAEKKKQDLIIDLVSMANANGAEFAVIITGIKEDQNIFGKVGIQKGLYSDYIYQELLQNAVIPSIRFTYHEVTDAEGMTFGFFVIQGNVSRPYILAKDIYGDFRKGTIPVRYGSTNQILINFTEVEFWKQKDNTKQALTKEASYLPLLQEGGDDKLTLFDYCDKKVDYDFSILPHYTEIDIQEIKKKTRINLVERWGLSGYETSLDIRQKIENENIKEQWIRFIGNFRITPLRYFLLSFIQKNHHIIKDFVLLEECFYALGIVATSDQLDQIFNVSQYILTPNRLGEIERFSHLLSAIMRTNFYINWRCDKNPDFISKLNEWVITFPDETISTLRELAERRYQNATTRIESGIPVKTKVEARDMSKDFLEFIESCIARERRQRMEFLEKCCNDVLNK